MCSIHMNFKSASSEQAKFLILSSLNSSKTSGRLIRLFCCVTFVLVNPNSYIATLAAQLTDENA